MASASATVSLMIAGGLGVGGVREGQQPAGASMQGAGHTHSNIRWCEYVLAHSTAAAACSDSANWVSSDDRLDASQQLSKLPASRGQAYLAASGSRPQPGRASRESTRAPANTVQTHGRSRSAAATTRTTRSFCALDGNLDSVGVAQAAAGLRRFVLRGTQTFQNVLLIPFSLPLTPRVFLVGWLAELDGGVGWGRR